MKVAREILAQVAGIVEKRCIRIELFGLPEHGLQAQDELRVVLDVGTLDLHRGHHQALDGIGDVVVR